MKLIRWLRYVLYIFLLLSGAIYFVCTTHFGAVSAIKIISKIVPGKLKVIQVAGQLNTEMYLENISYYNETYHVVIKKINFKWRPREIFNKKIVFDYIDIDGVNVDSSLPKQNQKHTKEPSDWSGILSIFDYLIIHQFRLNDVNLLQNKSPVFKLKEITLREQTPQFYLFDMLSSAGKLSGEIKWTALPNLTWHIVMAGQHVNGSIITPNLNSNINFNLSSVGEWQSAHKQVKIEVAQIEGTVKQYPVQGFISMGFEDGRLVINDSTLKIASSIVHVAGVLDKKWDIKWQLNVPKLETIVQNGHGSLASHGDITGTERNPIIEAKIIANDILFENLNIKKIVGNLSSAPKSYQMQLSLALNSININEYRIPQVNLQVASAVKENQFVSNLALAFSPTNQINGEVVLPHFQTLTDLNQSIRAHFTISFNALNEIIAIPEVSDLKGELQGSVKVAGKLSNPNVSLDALIKKGYLFIPRLRTAIEQINLQANADNEGIFKISGDFKAGDGLGTVAGQINLREANYPMTFNLNGSNLRLANSNEYKVLVSPNLNFAYANEVAQIQGEVNVPFAEITPKDFSSVTSLPSEVVIVDKATQAPTSNQPSNLKLSVQITLGKHILLAYENIRTMLTGNLLISQRPGSLAVATGELKTINGKYQAYGKSLDIQTGRLIYTGNILTNPGLDVRATQQFETLSFEGGESLFNTDNELKSVYTGTSKTLTVGVWVKGTLNKPKLSLYSEPAGLSQNDILSYLVFGYPQSQIKNASKLAMLNSLASGLYETKAGVGGVKEKVKNVLGLTDISVGETEYFDPESHSIWVQ